jgi:hypothetical protein
MVFFGWYGATPPWRERCRDRHEGEKESSNCFFLGGGWDFGCPKYTLVGSVLNETSTNCKKDPVATIIAKRQSLCSGFERTFLEIATTGVTVCIKLVIHGYLSLVVGPCG